MKRRMLILGLSAIMTLFFTTTACNRKTGCPSFDQKPKSEKAANKGGRSQLFPKNMRRN